MEAFGACCLIFDHPNAVTTNLELGRAWQLFCEQKNIRAKRYVAAPLTLDLETGAIVPQESNHIFSRKFHATFLRAKKKRLRDGTIRQWAFVAFKSTGLSYCRQI